MFRILLISGWRFLLLTGAVLFFVGSSPVLAQYFTIERFHSEITIDEDGSFLVKETIELTFDRDRHGIFREIPYRYMNELGDVSTTPLEVLSVKNDAGKSRPYKVSRPGGFVNIRIGDPDRYVRGRQVYVITYKVKNGLLFFDDHDELYWNVTGNEWKAPIRAASAEIVLETDKKIQDFTAGCYTGRYGSSESECMWEFSGNRAVFTCQIGLGTGEGFTVALGWDKGIVSAPTGWQKFWWAVNLRENWVYLVPVFVLFFMLHRWYRKGRDPKVREAVTVMYEPPKFDGRYLPPGEVGALVDERMDQRDITASVIGLAVKGYMKIEETSVAGLIPLFDRTDYKLIKEKDADDQLGPLERQLLNDIFVGNAGTIMVSEMKKKFYKNISGLKKTTFKQLVEKKYFPTTPEKVQGRYALVGFLLIFLGVFASFLFTEATPWKGIISFGLSGVIILVFSGAMPVKTRAGALARMEILGFQEFMNRADRDRLERMGEKDLFYKYLPYAIALDVVDNWADAFKDIYKEPPSWYASAHGFTNFNTRSFTQSLNTITTSLGSAMYSAPRGSGTGGGGGGFSGGGGGGGGGGSW
ncbi:MAG: DUF2207 domain-containing protein [candidate division Zixibacteria bacterium]|nr:DUF2207 domain-containing protein [candidate division Zixibacteria bacterium]